MNTGLPESKQPPREMRGVADLIREFLELKEVVSQLRIKQNALEVEMIDLRKAVNKRS